MSHRWNILALLFFVRTGMAFQFQTAASTSPALMQHYGVGLGDIGLLISLYLAPGLAIAIPGGQIGRRFGDKRVILIALLAMATGGVLMAAAPTWSWQIAGRILGGAGGVLVNVLMSKMVTDYFAGREIGTAMAIFVNSWPAGIALCLVSAPLLIAASGMAAVLIVSSSICAASFVVLALFYKSPATSDTAGSTALMAWPRARVVGAVVVAGSIWGLFNAAFGMVFGFGATVLIERGWSFAAAGSTTSLALWSSVVSVPLGGILADRTGKPVVIMLGSFTLFAAGLQLATRTDLVVPTFAALGFFGGLAAGPIMSLPARVLSPAARAVGMGIYFTLFYLFVVMAPIIAGWLAAQHGTARVAFDLGALMLLLCVPAYVMFNALATTLSPAGATSAVPQGP